jgi:hypothetical protein
MVGKNESDSHARKFQRCLSNHVTGVDKRQPFSMEEEAAVLVVLRQKIPWPCFPPHVFVGQTGFRSYGFHEKLAKEVRFLFFEILTTFIEICLNVRDISLFPN